MTTITLMTNDQALSVVTKPLVSSGDYNLVKVKVEFDSTWERYEVRSAVFRTMKGAEAEVLLIDDECTVPHEVLAEPGTLFIAMRGVTLSGKIIKTTEEVKYKVVQGAKDIASTTAPSHDMYAQYMAAIAAGVAPHLAAADRKLDEGLAALNALAGTFIRLKAGSYTGTGTFGADNPNTLTFDFDVCMVIIYKSFHSPAHPGADGYKAMYSIERQEFLLGANRFLSCNRYPTSSSSTSEFSYTTYTMSGKTLSWYNEWEETNQNVGAMLQMNSSGETYYYIAIGV